MRINNHLCGASGRELSVYQNKLMHSYHSHIEVLQKLHENVLKIGPKPELSEGQHSSPTATICK